MATKRTGLSSDLEQDGNETKYSSEEKEPSLVHNGATQTSPPVENESDLDQMQKPNEEDLENLGFREAAGK